MRIYNVAPGGVPLYQCTAVTLVNNTVLTEDVVVPEKLIWRIQSVGMHNGDNVARNCTCQVMLSDGVGLLSYLLGSSVTAGSWLFSPYSSYPLRDFLMDSFMILRFIFSAGGASAGGTGHYSILGDQWGKHEP